MSPHSGLIKDKELPLDEMLFLRSRLHWRAGNRRLREGKTPSAIATIYDALLSGMRWHILVDPAFKTLEYSTGELENERYVFHLLKGRGVIDDSLNIQGIQDIVDRALMEEDITSGKEDFVNMIETFLDRIGVLPFDESKLPPEAPSTF